MKLPEIKKIYFLGIGGIGMSALARYFHASGVACSGYDKTKTALSTQLEKEGIAIHYTSDISRIDKDTELAIYTPAIPIDFEELEYCKKQNIPLMKRAEVLGLLSRDKKLIAIAGTHGKTSITSLTGHILHRSGLRPGVFAGGIMKNYESNIIIAKNSELMLMEADEYDRSFLQLEPSVALISSMDADHLDIYEKKEGLIKAFSQFAAKCTDRIILKKGLDIPKTHASHSTYGFDTEADVYTTDARIESGSNTFSLIIGKDKIKNIRTHLYGAFNMENIAAASAIAAYLGVPHMDIKKGIESFEGVKRRFEYVLATKALVYIDDYAHHPEELKALLKAVREIYPDKHITLVFQPHLYSRTRDFMGEFAEILAKADRVLLLDIYPAREKPLKGVDSLHLLDMIPTKNKELTDKKTLTRRLEEMQLEVLITAGAGDIDKLVIPIRQALLKPGKEGHV